MASGETSRGRYASTDFTGWKLRSAAPASNFSIKAWLLGAQTETVDQWKEGLKKLMAEEKADPVAHQRTMEWWAQFWNRSRIVINPDAPAPESKTWQVGRNYQLWRYLFGCNAEGGDWPTKFNGGLITFDPIYEDPSAPFTRIIVLGAVEASQPRIKGCSTGQC